MNATKIRHAILYFYSIELQEVLICISDEKIACSWRPPLRYEPSDIQVLLDAAEILRIYAF